VEQNGQKMKIENHRLGYLFIRKSLRPNTAFLSVTGLEDHLIGFDMYTPPYDPTIRALRQDIRKMSSAEVDAAVVERIYETAVSYQFAEHDVVDRQTLLDPGNRRGFQFVLVDHYWAALTNLRLGKVMKPLREATRRHGLQSPQTERLVTGGKPRTPEEQAFMDEVGEDSIELFLVARQRHQDTIDKLAKLNRLLVESERFRLLTEGRQQYGVTVFRVVTEATDAVR
jgi:hypothetical protein